MRILGLDGGLACSGIAIEEDGTIQYLSVLRTSKKKSTPTESARMSQIFNEFSALLKEYKPGVVVAENQHVGMNKSTSMLLARVRGVFQVCCDLHGIPFYTIEPSVIKKHTTGKGRADKELMQESVKKIYNDQDIVQEKLTKFIASGKNKTDDMADALGIIHTYKVKNEYANIT